MIPPALVTAIRDRQVILFAGAGLSRNVGLPSWGELIDEMARQLDYDPAVFTELGDYLQLAEFYKLDKTTLGTLRSWMDRTWHKDESVVDKSKAHQAIIRLNFPIIYTTNYDRWLELAFQRRDKKFVKIANVGDFPKCRPGIPEIVKLHGDFEDDDSIVLTEASYFERLSFDSPLDIKLRSDIIGKAILFIGYGLNDINIRLLLYKLHKLWSGSAHAKIRPTSYIVLTRPNAVQEKILQERGITPIIFDNDDPGVALSEFLEGLACEALGITN